MKSSNSTAIAGTAILASVVIAIDVLRLKVPFPIFPVLKFDFMGVPILLALLLFGMPSMFMVSSIAFISIALRSPISALMKFAAELSTALGLIPLFNKNRLLAALMAVLSRVTSMTILNLLILPSPFYPSPMPIGVVQSIIGFIALFNLVEGTISVLGGYAVYEGLRRRMPSIIKSSRVEGH